MATNSSMLIWKIPWTEEPGRLQSTGSQESDTTLWLNHHQDVTNHCPTPAPPLSHPQPHSPPAVCLPASLMAALSWAQFRDPDRLVSCLWKTSWEEHKAKAEEASHLQAPPESPLHPSIKPAGLLVSMRLHLHYLPRQEQAGVSWLGSHPLSQLSFRL